MKHLRFILSLFVFISLVFVSCSTMKPKDFTCVYENRDTGLSEKINIDGYYVSQRVCDSSFYSVFMFYPDGLFTIATTSDVNLVKDCFEKGGDSNICKYPSWGTYKLVGDTIKTQSVIVEGMGVCIIFRDYLIQPDKSIVNVCDYVNPEKTKLSYMQNYPSFRDNKCQTKAIFYPLSKRRSTTDCPYLKDKWFYKN